MLQAGRDVCDGFEIGVDTDQLLKGGARYYDKRPMAKKMWATIMHALETVRCHPRSARLRDDDRVHHPERAAHRGGDAPEPRGRRNGDAPISILAAPLNG